MKERLNEVEARIAFQDRAIEELNDALVSHQKQLDQLERKVAEGLNSIRNIAGLLTGEQD